MSYDVDIAVIGAGPAGMSAAIRARWVKTATAVPASVVLLDPGGCGGIAALGTIRLVGPGFGFEGKTLVSRLTADIDVLEIPVIAEAVTGLQRTGDVWEVRTPHRRFRCLAVILATGIRRLTNERTIREAGKLTYLSGGYALSATIFKKWSAAHHGDRLLVIGGRSLAESIAQFQRYDDGRNQIAALCEPSTEISGYRLDGEEVVITGTCDAGARTWHAERVMLDCHSLGLNPPSLAWLPSDWLDGRGYSLRGPGGDTAMPGIYAAGDCTGPPSSCIRAIAQGSDAGFQAYRYVYHAKFGIEPDLLAFYPGLGRPAFDAVELPFLDPHLHRPVGLLSRSRFAEFTCSVTEPPAFEPLNSESIEALRAEIIAKTATVHLR